MAASGGSQKSLRKAIGVIKDSTKVGLVKVNSDYKDLDIAIVKATNHVELLPKEKHVRTIFRVLSGAGSRPRADISYCLHALTKRLAKTHTWAVALKTLLVIHRALRETGPYVREELLRCSESQCHMLNLSHFKDDSSPVAWDCSAWVRTYALYLEERLECIRVLKYDVQTDRLKPKELQIEEWLEELPPLQLLLYRLLACQPLGAARYNYLVQYALSIVAAESVKIYVAITDGILNLVDKFFEMPRHDAVRALEIYKKSGDQAERLSVFFEICRGLEFGKDQRYLKIEQPPESFIEAMEEYVMEAPQPLMLPWRGNDELDTPKAITASRSESQSDNNDNASPEEKPEPSLLEIPEYENNNHVAPPPFIDLLGLDEITPETSSELHDTNPLALALVNPEENPPTAFNSSSLSTQPSSWELALVTAASTSGTPSVETKVAGGLDRLMLDSLYDNALQGTNQSIAPYNFGFGEAGTNSDMLGSNPFETMPYNHQDSLFSSNNTSPLAIMDAQQTEFFNQQQQQQPDIAFPQQHLQEFAFPQQQQHVEFNFPQQQPQQLEFTFPQQQQQQEFASPPPPPEQQELDFTFPQQQQQSQEFASRQQQEQQQDFFLAEKQDFAFPEQKQQEFFTGGRQEDVSLGGYQQQIGHNPTNRSGNPFLD